MSTRNVLHMVVAGLVVAGCATDADGPATVSLSQDGDPLLMGQVGCAGVAARLGRSLGRTEARVALDEASEAARVVAAPIAQALDARHAVQVTRGEDGTIDWHADVAMDAVIVLGPPRRMGVYVYDPEAREDVGLTAGTLAGGGAPPPTEVVFCYDHELTVTATARPSLVRTRTWALELAPDKAEITVPAGHVKPLGFTAAVTPTGAIDSGWAVRGALIVHNPSPEPVELVAIGDPVAKAPLPVTCVKGAPPLTVPAFGAVACSYTRPVASGAPRTLAFEARTRGEVGPGVGTVPVDFAEAEVREVRDARVWVWDFHAGFLGIADEARVFAFEIPMGPFYHCPTVGIFLDSARLYGSHSASVSGVVAGAPVEAHTSVRVKVPCE